MVGGGSEGAVLLYLVSATIKIWSAQEQGPILIVSLVPIKELLLPVILMY